MDELDLDYYLTTTDPQVQSLMLNVVSLYYNSPNYIPDTPFEELPPETVEALILEVIKGQPDLGCQ